MLSSLRRDLTLSQKLEIINLFIQGGQTQSALSARFNCSQSQVSRILKNREEIMLLRWKERNNISFKRIYGEKKDSDINAAEYWCQWTLKDLLKDYTRENIYNCDETGLIFRSLPDRT
ncbi:uncharacterized protein LOC115228635 [Octopus sinensis]|uniref:Uncharacterized protein LOC115228635 n=1 Tax=Octopus sinensis TaxID=2607531 RepID=A0A7E6EH09_9MOLL|nr:uncharacterized protein LOC115228635 [Octopus sinensis]